MQIDDETSAAALCALGHSARLRLYRLLVRAGDSGLSVGEIGTQLALPASTLAHHLSALVRAGLVIQERQGRTIVNRADYEAMKGLVSYLTDECCVGVTVREVSTA